MLSPYRSPAWVTPAAPPFSTRASWIAAAAFAVVVAVPSALTAALVVGAGAAFLWPTPETRTRNVAVLTATLALAVWWLPSELLTVAESAACAWLAFELRRPLARSPWPVLGTAALAMAAPWPWIGPLAFALLFGESARSLARTAPTTTLPPVRHDLELVGAAFLLVATVAAGGTRVAVIFALAGLSLAMYRAAESHAFPIHIAIHGALIAALIASIRHDHHTTTFAGGTAIALGALAIVGIGIFLPNRARPKFAITIAGVLFGCGGVMHMMPFPIPLFELVAWVPSLAFIAIALKQANQR